ncbi:MAG: hypothetical protein H6741_35565 [Alphaproteobacteria bacterium]|nr:hypothetical protein [Alphaproteobacteria bacterium]
MAHPVTLQLNVSDDLARFRLPEAVDRRLQQLLGKQDRDGDLSSDERAEAEGLVEIAETLTLLRMRAERAQRENASR